MPMGYERSDSTPAGVEYTIRSRSESVMRSTAQPPQCTLVHVAVANSDDFLRIPCFTCSCFALSGEYYAFYKRCLTGAISHARFPHVPYDCAATVAGGIVHDILLPANTNARHRLDDFTTVVEFVSIYVSPRGVDSHVDGDINEEAGPRRERATVESLIEMVKARAELEAEEGGRLESSWIASEHECPICIDEIGTPWESLTMPCSHVFHEKCLLRWLDNNHACPLCRFKLPCMRD